MSRPGGMLAIQMTEVHLSDNMMKYILESDILIIFF